MGRKGVTMTEQASKQANRLLFCPVCLGNFIWIRRILPVFTRVEYAFLRFSGIAKKFFSCEFTV